MLFLLTGEVQIGKTRWLESLVAELGAFGVPCAGVLAPGQWVPSTGPHADANGFEKLGIDNVLLPSGERIPFARRGDLARADGTFDEESRAAKAELAWHIDDAAIDRVNAHFDEITAHASAAAPVGAKPHSERSAEGAESKDPSRAPGLLIVDELGRLEIWRGGGLTSAMALLAQGPTPVFPMRWPSCAIICSTTPRPSLPKRGLTAAAFLPMIQVEPLSCPPVSLGRKGQRLDKTGFGRDGYWAARF